MKTIIFDAQDNMMIASHATELDIKVGDMVEIINDLGDIMAYKAIQINYIFSQLESTSGVDKAIYVKMAYIRGDEDGII